MSVLEQKNDTMFEIINNIVKEITQTKEIISERCCPMQQEFQQQYQQPQIHPITIQPPISFHLNEKVIVSDDDDEDDDDDDDEDDDEDEDDEYDEDEEYDEDDIKVISVNVGETIDMSNFTFEEPAKEEVVEEAEAIHVEKINETVHLEEPIQRVNKVDTSKEIYNKMTVQSLKALVITKGLHSDPSKLKKGDLIKLLEEE
jgi:hypothetical protein